MIRFGPAGGSLSFYAQGHKHSYEAPAWIAAQGLSAYEYSAGHGVNIGSEAAGKIAQEAQAHDVEVSIHAPYYVNLSQEDPEKLQNSLGHLVQAAIAVRQMGGRRVVFHAGSAKKNQDRSAALARACRALEEAHRLVEAYDVLLCPETMGRALQLGTVEEVIAFCRVDERSLPTVDFAHLHAIGQGGITGKDDYRRTLDPLLEALGEERMRHFHSHFSHIAYTSAGEKHHVNFCDEGYGPDFVPLAELLREYRLEPTIICESKGRQTEDAATMKKIYEEAGA